MKRLLTILGVAALPPACLAGLMFYMATQHNSQGEFDGPTGELSLALVFGYVFLPWFLTGFLITGILAIAFYLLTNKSRGAS